MTSSPRRRVAYYYDRDVGSYTYGFGHVMKPHRIKIAHDLVASYNMLDKMDVLRPARCSPETMTSFHTDEYVEFLAKVTPETAELLTCQGTRFLVPAPDNPAFEGLFEFCSISAGGSIAAAERIASGSADVAINWAGGLHHAKKSEAAGFCYINDIVLGILELLRTYPRVLYIDIDCHHGDGVEEAFYTTDRVMTCSLHKYGDFFPGTGTLEDTGTGKGRGYSVNIPLQDGISDESFKSIFEPVMSKILDVFRPSVVVLQCGADSLAGDRICGFNLSMQGHAYCVQFLRDKNIPLILLGGGGYTVKNVARTWAYETACALGCENEIDPKLPWNEYFEWFGPRYRLEVSANNMEDLNVKDHYLDRVRTQALAQLSDIIPVPSVGLHDVPRESLGKHLGFADVAQDDLDRRLAQHTKYVYDLQNPSRSPFDELASSEDDDEMDSDDGSRSVRSRASSVASRRRQRHTHNENARRHRSIMSIMTNNYINIPTIFPNESSNVKHVPDFGFSELPDGKRVRRRFFQSGPQISGDDGEPEPIEEDEGETEDDDDEG
ncbi:histone deacetylase RPD3 [Mycena floridula]|nr:histone deacetylase RPD3 [Mycena floridula]